MIHDKEIDRLFSKKLKQREFRTDKSVWKNLEPLLSSEYGNRSWPGWKLWTLVSLFCILASVAPYISPFQNDGISALSKQNKPGTEQTISSHHAQDQSNTIKHPTKAADLLRGFSKKTDPSASPVHEIKKQAHDQKSPSLFTARDMHSEMPYTPNEKFMENKAFDTHETSKTQQQTSMLPNTDEKIKSMQTLGTKVLPLKDLRTIKERDIELKEPFRLLKRCALGLMTGGNISKGFVNTGANRAAISVRPLGGLRCAFAFNEAVSIGLDVIYQIRGGLNSNMETVQLNSYQTLNEWTVTKLETVDIHYLEFPVYFSYRHNRFSVDLGVQYARLITTYGKYVQITQNNQQVLSEESGNKWGRQNGFSAFDVAGIAGCNYILNEKWSVSGRMCFGLYDVTDDQVFKTGTMIDKNLQLKTYLTYRLFNY